MASQNRHRPRLFWSLIKPRSHWWLINVACWLKPVVFEDIILEFTAWTPTGNVTSNSNALQLPEYIAHLEHLEHTQYSMNSSLPKSEARNRRIISPKEANGGTHCRAWKSKQLILRLVQFPSQMSAGSQYPKMVSIFLVAVFLHPERRCQWNFPGLNQYDRTQVWSHEVRVFLRSLFCFDWSVINPACFFRRASVTPPSPPPDFLLSVFSLYPRFASSCEYRTPSFKPVFVFIVWKRLFIHWKKLSIVPTSSRVKRPRFHYNRDLYITLWWSWSPL